MSSNKVLSRTEIELTDFFAGGKRKRVELAELAEPACNCTCECGCICGQCDCECTDCDCAPCTTCNCFEQCGCGECACQAHEESFYTVDNDKSYAARSNTWLGLEYAQYTAEYTVDNDAVDWGLDDTMRNQTSSEKSDSNKEQAFHHVTDAPQE